MANKKLTYEIGIITDTTSLQASLKQAGIALQQVGTKSQLTQELQSASTAALELAQNLQSAINPSTGKFDILTFTRNLNNSGKDLQYYKEQLEALGPAGQNAFLNTAQAIAQAEQPLIRTNKLISDLWITMKNTVRWQLTTSVLHGFMGSIQTAYGYTKDLDSSLNSIRIVTGQSAEQMKEFAKQANDAAKALSTTTTDYTNASLIYYQQGLDDEQVIGRTDTTIKLANVANESADTASEQLTAIWNNFYDGSKSLEYYADVMVALGASTASSSDEIAQGIQKFAAVADTVGLSYEYAAAALATLTANTRESADVVGNSLKTLFARLQGLSLGETAEDGVDLTKYSQALEKVGVSVLDANGELRAMDDILDDTAKKWDTLTSAQQTALAETVAGVRQYTQFVALMNNWGDFQENLTTAMTSEGALQSQADIYAESWEAARDRIRASAEDIYDSLINADFYIDLDNMITPILDRTADVVDGLGGMQGILSAVAILMNKVYGNQIAQTMTDMATNIGIISGAEQERVQRLREQNAEMINLMKNVENINAAENARMSATDISLQSSREYVELQNKVSEYMDQLTPRQQEILKQDVQHLQNIQQQINKQVELQVASTNASEKYEENIRNQFKAIDEWQERVNASIEALNGRFQTINPTIDFTKIISDSEDAETVFYSIVDAFRQMSQSSAALNYIRIQLQQLAESGQGANQELLDLAKSFQLIDTNAELGDANTQQFFSDIQKGEGAVRVVNLSLNELRDLLRTTFGSNGLDLTRFNNEIRKGEQAAQSAEVSHRALSEAIKEVEQNMQQGTYAAQNWAEQLVRVGSAIASISMMINSIKSLSNAFDFTNDLDDAERFTQALTAMGMLIPSLMRLVSSLKDVGSALSLAIKGAGGFLAFLSGSVLPILAVVAGIGALVAIIYGVIKVANKAADAAKKAREEVESLKDSLQDLTTAYKELKDEISDYNDAKDSIKDLTEGTEEFAEAIKNANEQATALIEKYELFGNYKYDEQGLIQIDQDELNRRIADSENAQRNLERLIYQAQITSAQADLYEQAVNFSRTTPISGKQYGGGNSVGSFRSAQGNEIIEIATHLDEILQSTDNYVQIAGTNFRVFRNSVEQNIGALREFAKTIDSASNKVDYYSEQIISDEISNAYGDAIQSIVGENTSQQNLINQILTDAIKARVENIDVAGVDFKEAGNGKYADLSSNKQIAETYLKDALGLDPSNFVSQSLFGKLTYKDNSGESQTISLDDMKNRLAEIAEQEKVLTEMLDATEDSSLLDNIEVVLKRVNEQLGPEFATALLTSMANQDYGSLDIGPDIINTFPPEKIQEFRENIQAGLDLDENVIQELGFENGSQFSKGFLEALDSYDYQGYLENLLNISSANAKATDNIIQQLMSGDSIEDLDDSELEYLQKLEEEYGRLADIRNKNSADYIQALRDIREGQERVAESTALESRSLILKDANNEVREWIGKARKEAEIMGLEIPTKLDNSAFAEQMDDILQADYEVTVAINADIQSDFDDLTAHANAIEEAAGLIEEGFKVSYKNLAELQAVFPGILDSYTIAADGMIQLNKEVAQGAIDLAQTEISAEKESLLQKLYMAREFANAKAASFRLIIEGLTELNNSEITSEEDKNNAKEKIEQGWQRFEEVLTEEEAALSENLAKAEISDANQVMEADIDASSAAADEWKRAYQTMAENSGEWRKIAIENAAAVAKANAQAAAGEEVTVSTVAQSGQFKTKYAGNYARYEHSSTYEAPDSNIESWLDYYQKGDYQAALDEALIQLETWEAQVANFDTTIATIEGLDASIANTVKNIGKASKTSSKANKQTLKELKDVEDRYHKINREIERQDDLLSVISDDIDRSYGKEKLANYAKELEELQVQQDNYNKKLEEAYGYLEVDKTSLDTLFGESVQYGEFGELLNYKELLIQTVEDYNKAIVNATEDEKEIIEKIYDDRIDALKKYEETLDVIREMKDNIRDVAREMADNKLSQIEYKLEIVIDVKNMKDALREFDKQVQEIFNDALTHGIAVADIERDQAQAEADMYPHYLEQFNELKGLYESATDDADRQRIIDDIIDLQGKVLDSASAIVEWVNSIEDLIPAAVDAAATRFKVFTDQLDHNTTVLDTIKELYALQGVTYKTLSGFNQLQKVSQEKLETQVANAQLQRKWYEEAEKRLAQAQADLDSLNGDETDLRYDTFKKARDAYLAEFNEAQEAYLSLAQEAMETAQEMYLEQIEKAVYDFGQVVSDGLGLDLLQDKYDHFIEADERYFDKVNEAYQTVSWYNKLQADIDKTTNATTRDTLKKLQEEIDLRREGGKLSQYDLDILNAKYQVLQAQMALEDAQNAKNQLQLVRDRQGNWNYQYTANPDDVEDAEQDLMDSQIDWYNIAKQQVTDVTGEIVSTWQECQEKIQEVYSDMTLTDQERADRAAEIYEYYTEKIKYLEEEKQVAIKDMTEAGNANLFTAASELGDKLTDLTGMTADEVKKILEDNNASIYDIVIGNIDLIDTFDNEYAEVLDNMTNNTADFEANLRDTLDVANQDFLNYKDTINQVAQETGTTLLDLNQTIDQTSDSTDRLRDSGIQAAQTLWQQIDATAAAVNGYLQMAQAIWQTVEALRALAAAQVSYVENAAGTGTTNLPESNDYSKEMAGLVLNAVNGGTFDSQMYQHWYDKRLEKEPNTLNAADTGVLDSVMQSALAGNQNAIEAIRNPVSGFYSDEWEEWVKKNHAALGFDTGGYTGEFDNAKLAFLHQKELVLNQDDTKNILSAVNVIRTLTPDFLSSIEKSLDLSGISAMAAIVGKLNNMSSIDSGAQTIEQEVHIEANFPNVVNSGEIQDAFASLVNDAAQWKNIRRGD